MRDWFRAWQTGDYSTQDYRKYFKALFITAAAAVAAAGIVAAVRATAVVAGVG